MPARTRMIHRLFLQRNNASADAYGHKKPQLWQTLATVDGYAWAISENTQHRNEGSRASARYRSIVPLGTDVTEEDRVLKVENRADSPTELFGVMDIDSAIRRKNHTELNMRGHVAT